MGIHGKPVFTIQKRFKRYGRENPDKRVYRETGNIQLCLYPLYFGLPGTPETPVAL